MHVVPEVKSLVDEVYFYQEENSTEVMVHGQTTFTCLSLSLECLVLCVCILPFDSIRWFPLSGICVIHQFRFHLCLTDLTHPDQEDHDEINRKKKMHLI